MAQVAAEVTDIDCEWAVTDGNTEWACYDDVKDELTECWKEKGGCDHTCAPNGFDIDYVPCHAQVAEESDEE